MSNALSELQKIARALQDLPARIADVISRSGNQDRQEGDGSRRRRRRREEREEQQDSDDESSPRSQKQSSDPDLAKQSESEFRANERARNGWRGEKTAVDNAADAFARPRSMAQMEFRRQQLLSHPPDKFGATQGLLGAAAPFVPMAGKISHFMGQMRHLSEMWKNFREVFARADEINDMDAPTANTQGFDRAAKNIGPSFQGKPKLPKVEYGPGAPPQENNIDVKPPARRTMLAGNSDPTDVPVDPGERQPSAPHRDRARKTQLRSKRRSQQPAAPDPPPEPPNPSIPTVNMSSPDLPGPLLPVEPVGSDLTAEDLNRQYAPPKRKVPSVSIPEVPQQTHQQTLPNLQKPEAPAAGDEATMDDLKESIDALTDELRQQRQSTSGESQSATDSSGGNSSKPSLLPTVFGRGQPGGVGTLAGNVDSLVKAIPDRGSSIDWEMVKDIVKLAASAGS